MSNDSTVEYCSALLSTRSTVPHASTGRYHATQEMLAEVQREAGLKVRPCTAYATGYAKAGTTAV